MKIYTTNVEAYQFDPAARPLQKGIRPEACYCADLAQDGRHCPNHPEPVEFSFTHPEDCRRQMIRKGEWVVFWRGGSTSILSNDEFEKLFVTPQIEKPPHPGYTPKLYARGDEKQ